MKVLDKECLVRAVPIVLDEISFVSASFHVDAFIATGDGVGAAGFPSHKGIC